MQKYKVIGVCPVGGVAPGGAVTEEQLKAAGATNIGALVGPHLEPVAEEPPPKTEESKPEPKKATK